MATFTETLDATFTGIEVNRAAIAVKTQYTTDVSVTKKWDVKVTIEKKIKPYEG